VNIQLIPGRKQYYGLDKADSGKSLYYLMADQYKKFLDKIALENHKKNSGINQA
jgi:hypothetical protein